MRDEHEDGEDLAGATPVPGDLDPPPGRVSRAYAAWRALPERRVDFPLLDVLMRLLERHREMAGSLLAGALGYRLFLVALPLTLIAVGLLGFGESTGTADPESVTRELGLSGLIASAITTSGEQGVSLRWFTLVGGVVLLLWATHALLRALRTVHALAWSLPIKRLQRPVLAVTLASAVLLVSTVAAGGVNDATAAWPFWAVVANAAVFVGYAAVWLWVSIYLPSRAERWTQLLPGAVLFAVGVKAIQMFTVYYVAPFLDQRAEVYGALGYASMALLVLYAFGELAVLSALLNAAVVDHRLR
jgi:uncharacterized BrkB/YihY/UPF0761 family membrane protein